jgi:(E)-4-hydroxy-3-methyl-but-2-enyl pyrophosphate reductase
MKVKLAKTAGFCMGVRRAMEKVLAETHKENGLLYTFGPLIHNRLVLDLLASKGVKPVEDLHGLHSGRIVIRAHGIPPQSRQALKKTGLKIIDATCPRVARVQAIIRYHTSKGYSAIIVGDSDHAEVIGLMGYSKTPAHVIQSVREVSALPRLERVFVVAQTTQDEQNYRDVVRELKIRFPDILVFDTVCDATLQRQLEVRTFKDQVDAVVVVGGFHSGNTQRLVQVSREAGLHTFHVETEKDLDIEKFSGMEVVGITAGASTPNWIIKNVVWKIEAIPRRSGIRHAPFLRQVFKIMVSSDLVVASGAFFFAYAAAVLSGRNPNLIFPSLTFLYIYAMHVLNQFLDKGAAAYNDPERATFLRKNRHLLIMAGAAATLTAMVLSFNLGLTTFLALSGFSLLGIAYSVPLVPEKIRHKYAYSKIKDIPGSRSLSESLAWVTLISIVPLLEMEIIDWPATVVAILVVFSMSYARAVFFDLFQVQGDLIVGIETLPITLGERKTLILLKIILFTAGLILIGSPLFGLVGDFSFAILFCLLSLTLCLFAYERRWIYPGLTLEAMVEANFFLAGFLALIWQAL